MIMEINTNGLYSTILRNGGGNFLTQAEPTNFHTFAPSVYCLTADTARWREVTAKEKAAIEKADAKWVAPSTELIENARLNGIAYNADTGYFELNTLTDLTVSNVLAILAAGRPQGRDASFFYAANDNLRTNLAPRSVEQGHYRNCYSQFQGCHYIEVVDASRMIAGVTTFYGCNRLHTILNMYSLTGDSAQGCFRTYSIRKLYGGIEFEGAVDLRECNLLDVDSFEYWIAHKNVAGPVTITLHPDAYARVTEEIFALAAEKNITIATT